MKTKIKTSVAIYMLATLGILNISATIDRKKALQTESSAVKLEVLNNEVSNIELSLVEETILTAQGADAQVEKYASLQIELLRNSEDNSHGLDLIELYTAEGADLEIEKFAEKQVELVKNRAEK